MLGKGDVGLFKWAVTRQDTQGIRPSTLPGHVAVGFTICMPKYFVNEKDLPYV